MSSMMDSSILFKIKKFKIPFDLTVSGISMNPALFEGDIITVRPQDDYSIGDIVVFAYKGSNLLVHRLLKIQDTTFYCKGDNAFLLEHVNINDVLGKVVVASRNNMVIILPDFDDALINLSYRISKEFRVCGYSKNLIVKNDFYINYKERYLEKWKI